MDLTKYKTVNVSRGYTYRYYYSPATPGKPTLFFIHGCPSSSFDWHRQIAHFESQGYGLIVPDTLGYGGTSKPQEYEAFRLRLQALDLIDVLEAENPATAVIGIGHDWGSSLLSALAHWHQDRFAAFAWVAVGYDPPRTEEFVLQNVYQTMRELYGSDTYGYWEFFNEPDAHVVCEKNIDNFLQLVYPVTPEVWRDDFVGVGRAKAWIENNRQPGRAPWMTEEEYTKMRETLLRGGLQSPMNSYKAAIANVDLEDHRALPVQNRYINKPGLFVALTRDYFCRVPLNKANVQKYAQDAEIVQLNTGHWPQFEATEELNEVLEKWIKKLQT